MIDKFKGNSKVKEIIMDAEEEVNESKKSTIMKISLFEEYFNEAKSDVTPGSRVEVTGKSIGNMGKTLQGEVTRKNSNGTYEVSIDNGDMADYKADELKLIESVNEGAKILTKDLSREGEEFVAWIEKTMRKGSIKTISLEKNTAEITFNQNTDLSEDMFNMVREWPNAPSYMDLYLDVMSVNRGQLVMIIYGKRGMSFTTFYKDIPEI